jgi:hypothetical protein
MEIDQKIITKYCNDGNVKDLKKYLAYIKLPQK